MAYGKGGIAARNKPFGEGGKRSTAARIRGVGGLDACRAGTLTRQIPQDLKKRVDDFVYARDNNRCTRCTCTRAERVLTIAHIVPHAQGGMYTPSNLRVLCIDCHINSEVGTANRKGSRLLRGLKRHMSRR